MASSGKLRGEAAEEPCCCSVRQLRDWAGVPLLLRAASESGSYAEVRLRGYLDEEEGPRGAIRLRRSRELPRESYGMRLLHGRGTPDQVI